MIDAIKISKQFPKVLAVDAISFQVLPGEVYGLLGRNGAGKTTTLRMLATMLKPTGGSATVCGCDLIKQPAMVRQKIGLLFGSEAGLYDRLTARENIRYFARLSNISGDTIEARISELAGRLDFKEYLDVPAAKLSKGNRQKAVFARSIVHDPPVMLFDEPTSGLDVSAIRRAQEFIESCKRDGKCIILSSHVMSEVERLCDRVGIIDRGRLIAQGTQEELTRHFNCANMTEVFEKLAGDAR